MKKTWLIATWWFMGAGSRHWKGPTIREISALSGVGTATVDRVLNGRPGVREATRERVMAAFRKLSETPDTADALRIRLLSESGDSFNTALALAVETVNRTVPGIEISDSYLTTDQFDDSAFAAQIGESPMYCDGLILVAREHPAVNAAVRRVRKAGIPVVCLTSDLPSSRRHAYIGNDQYAAGCVAGQLIGHALPKTDQTILIALSAAFRSQQEREMGFRRVLRSVYPHLSIDERVIADDVPATIYSELARYFEARDAPAAIYNMAGGNRGVARALEAEGIADRTIFVGHELTDVSQVLLESGTMDYVISHDVANEVARAAQWIERFHNGITDEPDTTPILVHTRYNCRPA